MGLKPASERLHGLTGQQHCIATVVVYEERKGCADRGESGRGGVGGDDDDDAEDEDGGGMGGGGQGMRESFKHPHAHKNQESVCDNKFNTNRY